MPCTVIKPGDMADRILDREAHPKWNGGRCKMVYSFPQDQKLWDRYAEIRAESLRTGGDGSGATKPGLFARVADGAQLRAFVTVRAGRAGAQTPTDGLVTRLGTCRASRRGKTGKAPSAPPPAGGPALPSTGGPYAPLRSQSPPPAPSGRTSMPQSTGVPAEGARSTLNVPTTIMPLNSLTTARRRPAAVFAMSKSFSTGSP